MRTGVCAVVHGRDDEGPMHIEVQSIGCDRDAIIRQNCPLSRSADRMHAESDGSAARGVQLEATKLPLTALLQCT